MNTAFDLNVAIQRWREDLGQSPAFRSENLNELESHLRDSVAALQRHGLLDEEAFLVAVRRIGHPDMLQQQFGKLNVGKLWAERIVWMLIGVQLWMLAGAICSTAMMLFYNWSTVVYVGGQAGADRTFYIIAGQVLCWALIVLAGLRLWKLLPQRSAWLDFIWSRSLAKPFTSVAAIFVSIVVVRIFGTFLWAGVLSADIIRYDTRNLLWTVLSGAIPVALCSLITIVVAHKRQKLCST